jgi:hypothetical protein
VECTEGPKREGVWKIRSSGSGSSAQRFDRAPPLRPARPRTTHKCVETTEYRPRSIKPGSVTTSPRGISLVGDDFHETICPGASARRSPRWPWLQAVLQTGCAGAKGWVQNISIAVAVFALLGAPSGCGGTGGSSDRSGVVTRPATRQRTPVATANKTEPRQRYVRRADAVCRRLLFTVNQIRDHHLFNRRRSLRQLGFAELARTVRQALRRIERLPLPVRGRASVRHIYATAEAGTAELEQAAKDSRLGRKILAGADPFARTSKLARTYGLTACQTSPFER